MKKRILITGASGFVGRQIVKALDGLDLKIVPVVRDEGKCSFDGQLNIERIVMSKDIFQESFEWWGAQCKGVDIVIHAAWYTEPGEYLQSLRNMDCLIGSLNLAKGAVCSGVKRFVGIGTCFEYDLSAGVVSKDTQLKPLTPYASSKAALFMVLSRLLPVQSVEFAWCRLFYLYGEGEDERRLVPYLHKQLSRSNVVELTSGKQIRDFLDVAVAGRVIAETAIGEQCGVINVCSGIPITVRQIAEQIADKFGRRDLLKFGHRQDNLIDPPCVLGIPNYILTKELS